MPVRYLKPGIRDSEVIDALSAQTEVFFYRLLVTVDDFGRFDARPAMLKAQCFPIKDAVSAKDCESMLIELIEAGLVIAYESGTCKVLQVQKWDNKPRAADSKFPEFDDGCVQMYTDVCKPYTSVPLTVTETVTKTETETETRKARVVVGFDEFWNAYPKKLAKADAQKAFSKIKPDPELLATIIAAVRVASKSPGWMKDGGQYVPKASTWLNGKRWEDEVTAVIPTNEPVHRSRGYGAFTA